MRISIALCCLALAAGVASADENLRCLERPQPYYATLQQQAYQALDRRKERVGALLTREQILAYQTRQREFFLRQLGDLPEVKSPLNAVTTRTIHAGDYRIENVIFDSRPNHRITANLYLPEGGGPFPGVVVASGHSRTAKTADYNQRFALMMVRHGMAALCFDPIGQGERSQILDDEGANRFRGTTTEHFLVGVGSILVGRNTASYEVWDAMRAIDYLSSRPEIDAERIGMTGCSGGGTQTSYTMALDKRVRCAAPACYVTTFRRLIQTIGPQDSEQNLFGQISHGLDHPDYLIMRAPKPTLISATNGDYFPIEGSWDALRQAKQIYGRLGRPEQVDLVEGDGKHGVPPQNLATIGQWMKRWLLGHDEPVSSVDLQHRPEAELLCTKEGQVLAAPDELSVFDLNAAHEKKLSAKRRDRWATATPEQLRQQVWKKIGLDRGDTNQPLRRSEKVGQVQREGHVIDKFVLETRTGVVLPALVFRPAKAINSICLYLHPDGKMIDADAGGKIERIVLSGTVVVSVDLRGQGETGQHGRAEMHGDWKTFHLAYLLGQSLIGTWVEDTLNAARFASELNDMESDPAESDSRQMPPIDLIGMGEAGIVALHAAALEPKRFRSVRLEGTIPDWSSQVEKSVPEVGLDYTVHGALEVYDLPDLKKLAGLEESR